MSDYFFDFKVRDTYLKVKLNKTELSNEILTEDTVKVSSPKTSTVYK